MLVERVKDLQNISLLLIEYVIGVYGAMQSRDSISMHVLPLNETMTKFSVLFSYLYTRFLL